MLEPLKKGQVKDLIDKLSFFYQSDLEFLKGFNFYINNRNKVYAIKGDVDKLELNRVNAIGLYFGTFQDEERFRLSIEGSKFIEPKRNFIKLTKKAFESYICGENLFKEEIEEVNWEDNCPFLIVLYENEKLGSANIKGEEIFTYVPKSRKLDYNRLF